ncbi:MAG: hypothetical protein ACKVQV_05240 [Bacteroidia bacterium]
MKNNSNETSLSRFKATTENAYLDEILFCTALSIAFIWFISLF